MELHLKIIGIVLMVLALVHFSFPRYLKWKQELSSLSLINRQVMYVHSFFIALMVFLIGLLSLTCSEDLLGTVLGKRICLGIGIFWIARLIVQFLGYSSKNWKGKTFETVVHVLLSILWIYISTIFIVAYWR